jgi:hypothetical protein
VGSLRFKTRSEDGRTEAQIVIDLIHDLGLKPGEIVPYGRLHEALSRGEDERPAVQKACRYASDLLLENELHCLVAVAGEGYKVSTADRHASLGRKRESRSLRQFDKAIALYRNTALDDLDDVQRKLHVDTQNVALAAYNAMQQQEKRQRQIEKAMRSFDRRLGRVESRLKMGRPATVDHDTGKIIEG